MKSVIAWLVEVMYAMLCFSGVVLGMLLLCLSLLPGVRFPAGVIAGTLMTIGGFILFIRLIEVRQYHHSFMEKVNVLAWGLTLFCIGQILMISELPLSLMGGLLCICAGLAFIMHSFPTESRWNILKERDNDTPS